MAHRLSPSGGRNYTYGYRCSLGIAAKAYGSVPVLCDSTLRGAAPATTRFMTILNEGVASSTMAISEIELSSVIRK